jgi:hypothetical protein
MPAAAISAVTSIPPKCNQRKVGDLSKKPSGRPMTMKTIHKKCMSMRMSAGTIIYFL